MFRGSSLVRPVIYSSESCQSGHNSYRSNNVTIEISRDNPDGTFDRITTDQLIDMHCEVSYRQSVDSLISFMKFQISLDPDRYIEYIITLAEQHDCRVDHREEHVLCQER
jgi:hypothetical protein